MNKVVTDLLDVLKPAEDAVQFIRIRTFLEDISELEDMNSTRVLNALDLVARVFDKVGNDERL